MSNIEIRSITPEGGDVRIEEVDLDAERVKTGNVDREAVVALNGLANEYGDLADEASRMIQQYGQDEELQVSLSGLSDIMQTSAHTSLELKAKMASGASAETMLGGKTVEDFKDDYEYSIESMRNTIKKMEVVIDAVKRQDRLEDAREDVGEVHSASEIAKGIVEGQAKADQEATKQEHAKGLEAAQKKLDLRSIASILGKLSTGTPALVAENIGGLDKLLDGDGKGTLKASMDMNGSISQAATELSKRILMDQAGFAEVGIDAAQLKQLAFNLQALGENSKKRADQMGIDHRGVSKRDLGTLREQTDLLDDVKLLVSPNNAVGRINRDGKVVDADKRLAQLRQGKFY